MAYEVTQDIMTLWENISCTTCTYRSLHPYEYCWQSTVMWERLNIRFFKCSSWQRAFGKIFFQKFSKSQVLLNKSYNYKNETDIRNSEDIEYRIIHHTHDGSISQYLGDNFCSLCNICSGVLSADCHTATIPVNYTWSLSSTFHGNRVNHNNGFWTLQFHANRL